MTEEIYSICLMCRRVYEGDITKYNQNSELSHGICKSMDCKSAYLTFALGCTKEDKEEYLDDYEKEEERKEINWARVITKIVATIIALITADKIVKGIGSTMEGAQSPSYEGLSLIGWTVENETIIGTTGSGLLDFGFLVMVGIIGLFSICAEFIKVI